MNTVRRACRKLFPPSGYRSPLLSYPVLWVLLVAELCLIVHPNFGDAMGGDGESYFAAIDSLAAGYPDMYRTPVYPLILHFLGYIAGPDRVEIAVQAANCVFTVAGAWYFMHLAAKFAFGRPRVAFWLTALYCLMPWWHLWTAFVLTEPLALMGMSAYLYWTVRDLPVRPGVVSGVMSAVWLAFLVFLRPVMMCVLPVALVYWWALRRRGRGARAGLAGTALCVALVAAYTGFYGHVHGSYKLSAVSQWNNYNFLTQAGLHSPGYTSNPALAAFVESTVTTYDTICAEPLIIQYQSVPDAGPDISLADIDGEIYTALRENPREALRAMWVRLRVLVWNEPLLAYDHIPELKIVETTWCPVTGLLIIFQILSAVWLARLWRRGVRPPGAWLCWGVMVALSWSSFAGAYYEWNRLTVPAIPAILMLGWQMLSFTRPTPYRKLP